MMDYERGPRFATSRSNSSNLNDKVNSSRSEARKTTDQKRGNLKISNGNGAPVPIRSISLSVNEEVVYYNSVAPDIEIPANASYEGSREEALSHDSNEIEDESRESYCMSKKTSLREKLSAGIA